MIEFNPIFCADLKDDFEEIGRNQNNFELSDFIQKDLSRAFAFGYFYLDWAKEGMWIPVSIRKTLRHLSDNLNSNYNAQLEWLNKKYNKEKIIVEDYANYILSNMFCDDENELLKIAILLGSNLRNTHE